MATIHPTAIIDPTARLADSVCVGPYCIIGPEVTVGDRTVFLNNVTVQALTRIGRGNTFYPYSIIGGDPQDRKWQGERTTLEIGDNNVIRELVTIHRGTENGGSATRIGSNNLIMGSVHIAHDCEIGDEVTIANLAMLAGHVRVQNGASIGGGAGLHHFATVGTCAFVAAMARVPKDVPPYMIVEGSPADVRAINVIAMTRRGFTSEHIEAVKEAYKRLYRTNGAPMSDKIVELKRDFAHVPAVIQLCDSLEAVTEGVHGRSREATRPDDKRNAVIETAFVSP